MTAIERLIATAAAEIGYLEKATNSRLDDKTANAGDGNWTKYARDLDALKVYNGPKNGYAWCAVFVFWCLVRAFGLETALKMTGQKLGGYGAGCTECVNYYKAIGRFYKSGSQPGDQIFFTNDGGKTSNHTGIVTRVDGNNVYTIEGNTSSLAGVDPNGGCVRDKVYSLAYSKIMGYGRPDYSAVEKYVENVESEDDNMQTYEQWKAYMGKYLAERAELAAPGWSEEELAEAVAAGITDGTRPQSFPSRVETAVMALRASKRK